MFYLNKTLTMQKLLLTILTFITLSSQIFSQENAIKSYPLKDYIAPDIKYRLLDFGGFLGSSGNHRPDEEFLGNTLSSRINFHFANYRNTSKFQGISEARLNTQFAFSTGERDTSWNYTGYNTDIYLDYYVQNRFYKEKEKFWGIHGGAYYLFKNNIYNSNKAVADRQFERNQFSITPYISFGKGRIQPIRAARQAQDILLSLNRYNRLSVIPDNAMIDSLSHVANRITFKRFYDSRFKRIYQLKELDKAIQSLNLVDTLDMIYFANLNDIWNYANTFRRGAGTRIEGGVIPLGSVENDYSKSNTYKVDEINTTYGIYGFVSFNRMKPVSYSLQSDLMIDLTFGYESSYTKTTENDTISDGRNSYLKGMLNASWQFGFYPNTRTFAAITPFTTVSFFDDQDIEDSKIGVNTGFRFDSYYYISPRFRLSVFVKISYFNDFIASVPTPFWNNVRYIQNNNERYDRYNVTNDFSGNHFGPTTNFSTTTNGLSYNFGFSFNYAIF